MDAESEPEIDMDEGDLEKLESDLRQMAKKISEYRQTLPDHLCNTFHSALSSHRPVLPRIHSGSDPLPSQRLTIAEAEIPGLVLGTQEQDYSQQTLLQLKDSVSRNAANIPKLVKRVRECLERIDKLDSLNGTIIHPAFRKRRIN